MSWFRIRRFDTTVKPGVLSSMPGKFIRSLITPALLTALTIPCLSPALTSASVSGSRAGASLHQAGVSRKTGRGRALWPGARFTEQDRVRAIRRGLRFIYRTALERDNFERYGSDYLWCFYTIGAGVSDRGVRR